MLEDLQILWNFGVQVGHGMIFRRRFVSQTDVTWTKRGAAKLIGCLRNLTREAGSERWSILSVEEAFPTDFIAICVTYFEFCFKDTLTC